MPAAVFYGLIALVSLLLLVGLGTVRQSAPR